jgi:hypothetical protein
MSPDVNGCGFFRRESLRPRIVLANHENGVIIGLWIK